MLRTKYGNFGAVENFAFDGKILNSTLLASNLSKSTCFMLHMPNALKPKTFDVAFSHRLNKHATLGVRNRIKELKPDEKGCPSLLECSVSNKFKGGSTILKFDSKNTLTSAIFIDLADNVKLNLGYRQSLRNSLKNDSLPTFNPKDFSIGLSFRM